MARPMESPRGLDRPDGIYGPPEPVTGSKVRRLARHTQRLVDDLQEWVDLRVELAQIQLEERVEAKANQILVRLLVISIVLLAGVFGLVTIALALGAWLGHPAWGFLIVTLGLVGVALVLRAARPEFVQVGSHGRSAEAPPPGPSSPTPPPQSPAS